MLRLAWRNLWRNRTRTTVSIAAIAITYALYLVSMGIQEYTYSELHKAAEQAAGGAVIVQGAGYQELQLNDVVIAEPAELVEKLRSTKGVEHVAQRVIINGLVSTSASSNVVPLRGIEPEIEKEFQDLDKYLVAGTLLQGTEEKAPIVLGKSIVDELEIEVGDRVVVTANGPDGEMQRALFRLSGVLSTGTKFGDQGLAFTTLAAAQKALRMNGEVHQIGLRGSIPRHELKSQIAGFGSDAVEILTWDEAMPDLVGFIEMDKAYGDVYGVVIFLVVLFAIMNTFLMVVMERIRELGLLGAIGLTPRRTALLVLYETILLAAVALVVGFALGFAGHSIIAEVGIDFSEMYGDNLDIAGVTLSDTMVYSLINVGRWVNVSISVLVMVLVSAAYPAWKAARLTPADAMRFYE